MRKGDGMRDRSLWSRLGIGVLACWPAWGAVQGVVINGTTGQPQGGVAINLVQPGAGGMQTLGATTSDTDGIFSVDQNPGPGGPALIQSTYTGVTYTKILPPGTPTTGVQVTVYNATAEPPAEMRIQHLILLEPGASSLKVSETFYTQNASQLTYQDEVNGSVRFYLPEGAPEGIQATIDSTGVPIRRPIEKGKQAGLYKISYPLKPGDTRFDLEYTLPASATFSGKVLTTDPPARLVTPATVTLSGEGIVDAGQEPTTGARVYTFTGSSFQANILGVGSLGTGDAPTSPEEDPQAPTCCEEVPARLQSQMGWILGLGFGILFMGGLLLYRRGAA
jgi:hypothetical protein